MSSSQRKSPLTAAGANIGRYKPELSTIREEPTLAPTAHTYYFFSTTQATKKAKPLSRPEYKAPIIKHSDPNREFKTIEGNTGLTIAEKIFAQYPDSGPKAPRRRC